MPSEVLFLSGLKMVAVNFRITTVLVEYGTLVSVVLGWKCNGQESEAYARWNHCDIQQTINHFI